MDHYDFYLEYERALGIIDFLQVAHGRRDLFEVHHVVSHCLGMTEIWNHKNQSYENILMTVDNILMTLNNQPENL